MCLYDLKKKTLIKSLLCQGFVISKSDSCRIKAVTSWLLTAGKEQLLHIIRAVS